MNKICELFANIALDNAQVFEIRLGGANQFRYDIEMMVTGSVLDETKPSRTAEVHLYQRLKDVIELMTMEWHQFCSLRDAFFGIVVASDDSLLEQNDKRELSIDDIESCSGMVNILMDMLSVRRFRSLELSDAVWIMNKRKE